MTDRRFVLDLAAAIKKVAKDGAWEESKEEENEIDPEKIIRRTMASYMGGSVPGWFLDAVQATSYVLSVDKSKGIECVAALHEAAERAPAELRMAAQTKLLAVCQGIGLFGGLGRMPVL